MARPISKRVLLEEFRTQQKHHQDNYDHLMACEIEPERAEYNEHMVRVMEYLCDLIEADISDEDQMIEEGINE